jgi:hypothetical protein
MAVSQAGRLLAAISMQRRYWCPPLTFPVDLFAFQGGSAVCALPELSMNYIA